MTSSVPDLRLPFDRPWRGAVAIYAHSLKQFALACWIGLLPIILTVFWLQFGVWVFTAALSISIATIVLIFANRRRNTVGKSDVSKVLEETIRLAELRWEVESRRSLEAAKEKNAIVEAAFEKALEQQSELRALKEKIRERTRCHHTWVLLDAETIEMPRLESFHRRLTVLHGHFENARHQVLETPQIIGAEFAGEVRETFLKVASSRAETCHSSYVTLQHFYLSHTAREDQERLRVTLQSLKGLAVQEILGFAKVLAETAVVVHNPRFSVHGPHSDRPDLDEPELFPEFTTGTWRSRR